MSILFNENQLKEVSESLNDFIDTSLYYNLQSVRDMDIYDWKLLKPICINSNYSRAFAAIAIRVEGSEYNNAIVGFICGYRKGMKWFFFRPGVTQFLQVGANEEGLLSFKQIQEFAKHEIFPGYLKYNKKQRKWKINDSFFHDYMDNMGYAKPNDNILLQEYPNMPDSFWVNRYMEFTYLRERRIQLIKNHWYEEDKSKDEGLIKEAEWLERMRLRNPKTEKDWKQLEKFQKELDEDPYIQSLF